MVTKLSHEIRTQPKTIRKRMYKNFSPQNFLLEINSYMQNGKFDIVTSNNNIEEASAIFSGIFGSILNRHAPLKTVLVRSNYVPWISTETKQLQTARDFIKKEAINENCAEKFEVYKKLRNIIQKRLNTDKLNYYKTKFYQERTSSSDLWAQANNFLNTSSKSYSNTPNMISHHGRLYTAPRGIANALNEAFLDKARKLTHKTPKTVEICPLIRLRKYLATKQKPAQKFELKQIDKYQLRKILKKRKGNRSSGIDFIDGYSIKLAAPLIEDVLLHLINLSILNSTFPKSWKMNKVSPQFKKGDRLLGENWRPVTDIVFVSKLVEAAVYEQLNEYFSANDLWLQRKPFNHYCHKPDI